MIRKRQQLEGREQLRDGTRRGDVPNTKTDDRSDDRGKRDGIVYKTLFFACSASLLVGLSVSLYRNFNVKNGGLRLSRSPSVSIDSSQNQFSICYNWSDRNHTNTTQKEHSHTNRNLDDYHLFFPYFFDWYSKGVETIGTVARVLEVGCGSARALLDLQSCNPFIDAIGTNVGGWGRAQVEVADAEESGANSTTSQLLGVAELFEIEIYCDRNSHAPILPTLLLAEGIQHADLPLEPESVDFVISRYSFGKGKLKPFESHWIIPRVLRVLKPEGSALLHFYCFEKPLIDVTTDSDAWVVNDNDKRFLILDAMSLEGEAVAAGTSASVVFFQTLHMQPNNPYCVNALLKKCLAKDSRHPEIGGCAIPASEEAPHDWLKAKKDWIQQIESTNQTVIKNYNIYQYFSNMMDGLKK